MKTARELGLGLCPKCHKVNTMQTEPMQCVRCHGLFYQRNRNSLQYTLAWNIAALLAFIPANLYPIMIIYSLGIGDESTILSGIGQFVDQGLYPIAVIIFTASIIVPLIKIIGLFVLVYKVHTGVRLKPDKHSKIYHILEFLGPWSMLDVFVVALLVAVVELGFVTSVAAGPAINYFTMTVIFTMIAANSFDPRLLWDKKLIEQNGHIENEGR
ncbi:paraquat-inducible protein A [Litorilituus lipolyticus]|uniref:Paraquat-inducible membrane protein A n=1 Tax=Litorilituus lipolyticus TaxID=2491017 RepID=A0A502KP67_9GAMM|nr:paraquat-inducible protein A [Litorilituus lipolyticus]TPH13402.1 paraquat-inducible membrane protein A [Litorilituus lipolyticus]